jgi:hypothetical protein
MLFVFAVVKKLFSLLVVVTKGIERPALIPIEGVCELLECEEVVLAEVDVDAGMPVVCGDVLTLLRVVVVVMVVEDEAFCDGVWDAWVV